MSITIYEIAKEACVSTATVSRVLNNSAPVKTETKRRINEIIEKYKFSPNHLARSLIMKETNTIGILVTSMNESFFHSIVRGCIDEFSKYGYNVILSNTDNNVDAERNYTQMLLNKQVDGLIFIGSRFKGKGHVQHIIDASKKVPVVITCEYIGGDNVYSVMLDEWQGSYDMTKYLIGLGHRRIAYLNGTPRFSSSVSKLNGYKKALEDAGIAFATELIIKTGYDIKDACNAVTEFLDKGIYCTAFFASTDLLSVGVLKALKSKGLSAPKDVSVAGFDNTILTYVTDPEITTVDGRMYDLGKTSANTMHRKLSGEEIQLKKTVLGTRLVERESCRPV